MTKPQLLFAAPFAGLALSIHDRRLRPALLAIAGTGIGTLFVLAYNWHRFGSALSFGGANRRLYIGGSPGGRSSPLELFDGATQLLFSLNHGLLFFAPVALLGLIGLLRRPIDRVAAVCLGGSVGVFGFAMIAPYGQFWGTRYLVPMLPLACVGIAGPGLAREADRGRAGARRRPQPDPEPRLLSRAREHRGRAAVGRRVECRTASCSSTSGRRRRISCATRAGPTRPRSCTPSPRGGCCASSRNGGGCCRPIGIPRLFGAGLSLILLVCAVLLVRQAIGRPRNRSRPVPPFERAEKPWRS